MPDIDIFIYPDGSVAHLHSDAFRLENLGPAQIKRASTVEPSPDSKKWEVRLPHSQTLVATADRRQDALSKEVAILNNDILPTLTSATQKF